MLCFYTMNDYISQMTYLANISHATVAFTFIFDFHARLSELAHWMSFAFLIRPFSHEKKDITKNVMYPHLQGN